VGERPRRAAPARTAGPSDGDVELGAVDVRGDDLEKTGAYKQRARCAITPRLDQGSENEPVTRRQTAADSGAKCSFALVPRRSRTGLHRALASLHDSPARRNVTAPEWHHRS